MTRAVVGIVIALLVLVWPHRTDQILARLLGAGLMIASATSFWGAVRHEPRQFLSAGTFVVSGGAGLALVLMAGRSWAFLGRLLSCFLLIVVIGDLAQVWRADAASANRTWTTTRSLALTVLGVLLIAFPTGVLAAATAAAAILWIAASIVVIAASLDADNRQPAGTPTPASWWSSGSSTDPSRCRTGRRSTTRCCTTPRSRSSASHGSSR